MTKVLFIAYQFPPRSGPGVHRSLNFVKYLRDFGYEPLVLTTAENSQGSGTMDATLLDELPCDTKIIRTPTGHLSSVIGLLMKYRIYRLFWFFFYPILWEESVPWANKSFAAAKNIIELNNIKLVYTSSGPFSSLILGRKLQKECGLKWVADLRDPFTDAYAWLFPSKLHWLAMRMWEGRILKYPDALVVNTDAVKRIFLKRGIGPKKLYVINNGY